LLEIRFHGRGGQGVVTASNLLATAAGYDGLWASSFPVYGAERRGAEIEAYCRISEKEIRLTSPIEEPDIIVILDKSLLKLSNPLRGLKRNGSVLINSNSPLDLNNRSYYVDATKIAINLKLVKSGWPLVNIVMLGALARVIGVISIKSLSRAVREEFDDKIAEQNVKAIELAYNSVKEVSRVIA
jgi:pyruvate ferredoxin oxidoreductase gamma subunit